MGAAYYKDKIRGRSVPICKKPKNRGRNGAPHWMSVQYRLEKHGGCSFVSIGISLNTIGTVVVTATTCIKMIEKSHLLNGHTIQSEELAILMCVFSKMCTKVTGDSIEIFAW